VTEVCVVHLVWGPLGREPLERFAASYRRHSAGLAHRLVLLLNGFASGADAARAASLVDDLEPETLVVSPPRLDLPAYGEAARRLEASHLCFLNSHSTPLASGWLAKLHAALCRPGTGLVGATGSYEAPRSLNPLRRRRWPRFPNPHIRTNAFMLSRDLMTSLRWPDVRTKSRAWELESGTRGLTQQVWARGLLAVVVGRDGDVHPPEQWPASSTFRSGGQANLLVADNRTRQWEQADAADRRKLSRLAWGASPAAAAAAVASRTAARVPTGGGARVSA
jgi:hypothetical protein